jgi:hypothetical protein
MHFYWSSIFYQILLLVCKIVEWSNVIINDLFIYLLLFLYFFAAIYVNSFINSANSYCLLSKRTQILTYMICLFVNLYKCVQWFRGRQKLSCECLLCDVLNFPFFLCYLSRVTSCVLYLFSHLSLVFPDTIHHLLYLTLPSCDYSVEL